MNKLITFLLLTLASITGYSQCNGVAAQGNAFHCFLTISDTVHSFGYVKQIAKNSIFPDQTGQSGKVLGTNGSVQAWVSVATTSGTSSQYIKGDGTFGTLSGSNGITVNPSSGVISKTKRQETYTGTTNSSGIYTLTYGTAFSAEPNVQFQIKGGTNKTTILLVSSSATACSFFVEVRSDVLGLLPSYAPVNGAIVKILITEE